MEVFKRNKQYLIESQTKKNKERVYWSFISFRLLFNPLRERDTQYVLIHNEKKKVKLQKKEEKNGNKE